MYLECPAELNHARRALRIFPAERPPPQVASASTLPRARDIARAAFGGLQVRSVMLQHADQQRDVVLGNVELHTHAPYGSLPIFTPASFRASSRGCCCHKVVDS